jgi:molybdenum-dependent DNA-binding transcriptional regulator ModE
MADGATVKASKEEARVDWLNYHHLLYFWQVAREGSVVRAARTLHLSQPTVSAQVRALERAIGQKLFQKQGRFLVLIAFVPTRAFVPLHI